MKWRTAISTKRDGANYVYGHKLADLAETHTFTDVIFLLLSGKLPDAKQRQMLDVMLVCLAEHGIAAPSAFVARASASVGNPPNAALAAGLLATGDWHGGAIEQAALTYTKKESADVIVREALDSGKRLAGYGHKVYKDEDPRATQILNKAEALGFSGAYVQKARDIESQLTAQKGSKLPLNIDGAIAAVLVEMGIDWQFGKAFFALGRLPGMIAHVHEEMTAEKPFRRLDEDDIEYTGKPLKKHED